MSDKTANVKAIFGKALEIDAHDARSAFLDEACGGNQQLRHEVDDLLQAIDQAGSFMARPVMEHQATIDQPITEKPGTQIGPYKLLQQIGEGGMGVVYMAEQKEPVKRRVALKVIKPGMDTQQVIARFEAERQALAMMDHPNIAKVLDAGQTDSGRPYFVMELVNGISVTKYCDQEHLTPKERLELFLPICQAVQHAHQKGIIHRDLKPSNVLVALYDGQTVPKVIDFGVAKATSQMLTDKTMFTQLGQIVGTMEYMSPEQAQRNQLDVDTRSDIYSLGVVLYELLTGDTPFDRQRLRSAAFDEMLRIIREEAPQRPSTKVSASESLPSVAANRHIEPQKLTALVRGELDWIVMKALEKDRSRRYATANGFAADIQRFLNNETVQACPPSAGYRLRKFAGRNKAALVTTALVAATLFLGVFVSTWQAMRAHQAKNLAEVRYQEAEEARHKEGEQRQLAEQRGQLVAQERDTALRAEARAAAIAEKEREARQRIATLSEQDRRRLVQLNVATGQGLLESGDVGGSLPWFVEALRLDAKNEERSTVHRTRIARCLERCPKPTYLWFHEDQVDHAEFNTSGNRVVTASRDGTARIWSLAAGQSSVAVLRHHGPVNHASFSPDGRLVATASDDATARVWDSSTGEPVTPPLGHSGAVVRARFSPDGSYVATASRDKSARVWKIPTGEPITPFLQHRTAVTEVAFGPGGRRLYSASGNHVRAWDVPTTEERAVPLLVHTGGITALSIDAQGKHLVTAGWNHTAQVWSASSGEPVAPSLLHDSSVLAAKFNPDGDLLVTASRDGTARIWDVSSGALRHILRHADHVYDIACSRNGRQVVTTCKDGTVRLWNMRTGGPVGAPVRHAARVECARLSGDGRWLLTASDDHSARVWDLASTTQVPLTLGSVNSQWILNSSFSSNGGNVLTVTDDAVAKIWDARTGEPVVAPLHHHAVVPRLSHLDTFPNARALSWNGPGYGAKFNHTGRMVLTWDWNGSAVLWDLFQQKEPVTSVFRHALDELPYSKCHADLSPDGRLVGVAISSQKQPLSEVRVWSVATGNVLVTIRQSRPISYFAFTPDSSRLVTCGTSDGKGEVRFWDGISGEQVGPTLVHALPVIDLRFSTTGELLVTTSGGNVVTESTSEARVWDVATGEPVTPWLKHPSPVTTAVFSPDDRLVATTSADKAARVWDVRTGKLYSGPMWHKRDVVDASWSPDGRFLATAGLHLWLWDVATGNAVGPPSIQPGTFSAVEFCPDGESLASVTRRYEVRKSRADIWRVSADLRPVADLEQLAQLLAGYRIAENGKDVPLPPSLLRQTAQMFKASYPDEFIATKHQVRNWNENAARECLEAQQWRPALEHLDQLVQVEPDRGEIRLQRARALERIDPSVLDAFDTGNLVSMYGWMRVSDTRTTPLGTRLIRIRLISTRTAGFANNGVFDNLSLVSSTGRNLIENPSNELPLDGDKIRGWSSHPLWKQATGPALVSGFAAHEGQYVFWPPEQDLAELRQDIDVAEFKEMIDKGEQPFSFEGYVRTYPQINADPCRIIVEYRSSAKDSDAATVQGEYLRALRGGSEVTADYLSWLSFRKDRKAYEEAISALSELATRFPGTPLRFQNLAETRIQFAKLLESITKEHEVAQKQRELATEALSKAISQGGDSWLLRQHKATVHESLEQWKEALVDHSACIAMNGNYGGHFLSRALCFVRLGQWENAIADLSTPLEREPFQPYLLDIRAHCYRNLKDWEHALADLSKAIKLKPKAVGLRLTRGRTYAESQQWKDAASDFASAAELQADDPSLCYYQALARLATGDVQSYCRVLEKMQSRFSEDEDPRIRYRLAWTTLLQPIPAGQADAALQVAQSLIEPTLYHHRLALAATLSRCGKLNEAITQLEQLHQEWEAAEQKPTRVSPAYVWFFLAMAYRRQGDTEQAQAWRDRAVRWVEEESAEGKPQLPWNRRLTYQLLQAEVEQLMSGETESGTSLNTVDESK